ncbi:DUF3883 domain-containing protein [Kitasatospora sp. NPDC059646]|uniref:DUF3883 domain-containing protein n=1 Tax=Kitasatospora sp. NPDC059646 TaxID=3346893 RepID=UPI0036920671
MFGVQLLTDVASLAPRGSLGAWLQAARAHSSHLIEALDLAAVARSLVDAGLVDVTDGVSLGRRLSAVAEFGDQRTLQDVARVLLVADPPPWLLPATRTGAVVRAYIPTDDLKALTWLEAHLDRLLLDASAEVRAESGEAMRERLGEAAEQVVLHALRQSGHRPIQVSRISDSFGYDIEVRGATPDRIEVKAASVTTMNSFHLSRNEFETGIRYGAQWRLVQVVFDNAAFAAGVIEPRHLAALRELEPGAIARLVPADVPSFVWEQSAVLTPDESDWRPAGLDIGTGLRLPGFAAPKGSAPASTRG